MEQVMSGLRKAQKDKLGFGRDSRAKALGPEGRAGLRMEKAARPRHRVWEGEGSGLTAL